MKAEDKGVELKADLSEVQNTIINHDEMRIQQVLLNFQSNALKFTDSGSVTIKVNITLIDQDKYLEVSVIDTGIGIKEEDQPKLFKLFGYVQDSKQMNTHGIGLGLTISKKIIDQFNGEVSMSSKEGEGSTFKFMLKLFEGKNQRPE